MYQRHHQSSGASNASSPSSAPVRAMYDEKLRQLQQQVLRLQESDRQKAREIVSLQSEIKASKQEIPVRFDKAVVGNRADTAPKRPARLEPLQGIRRQGDLVKNNPSQPEEPLRVENRRPSAVEGKKARDKASPLTQHSRMKAVRVGEEDKALGERLRTQRKPVGSGITSSPVNSNPAQRSVPDYEAEYATSMSSSQGVTKERRYPVPKGTVPGDKDESALDSEPEPVQTNRCFVTISRENLTACAKTGIITERVAEKFWQFCLDRVSSEKNDLKIDCTALPEGATRKDSRDQNMDLNPHPPGYLTNGIIPHEAPLRRQAQ